MFWASTGCNCRIKFFFWLGKKSCIDIFGFWIHPQVVSEVCSYIRSASLLLAFLWEALGSVWYWTKISFEWQVKSIIYNLMTEDWNEDEIFFHFARIALLFLFCAIHSWSHSCKNWTKKLTGLSSMWLVQWSTGGSIDGAAYWLGHWSNQVQAVK